MRFRAIVAVAFSLSIPACAAAATRFGPAAVDWPSIMSIADDTKPHPARDAGKSVENTAKDVGRGVERGAKQVGRSVVNGWESFKRAFNGGR